MTAFVHWDPEDVGIESDEDGDLWDVNYVRSDWTFTEEDAVEQVAAALLFRLRDIEALGYIRVPEHPDQPVETRKRKDGMWQAAIRVIRPYVHEETP